MRFSREVSMRPLRDFSRDSPEILQRIFMRFLTVILIKLIFKFYKDFGLNLILRDNLIKTVYRKCVEGGHVCKSDFFVSIESLPQ